MEETSFVERICLISCGPLQKSLPALLLFLLDEHSGEKTSSELIAALCNIFSTKSLLNSGEARFVRFLRGFLGLAFVALLFFYAMVHMIFQPIRETSLTPVQAYHSVVPPTDYKIDPPLWNIVIGPVSVLIYICSARPTFIGNIFQILVKDIGSQQAIISSVNVITLQRPSKHLFIA